MSVAGKYQVQVMTPIGLQEGILTLVVEGDLLKGILEYSGGISEITSGIVKGNNFEFTTVLKTPFGPVKALVKGIVEGNRISGAAKLPFGSVQIDGRRRQI